eukprot:gene27032-34151_t
MELVGPCRATHTPEPSSAKIRKTLVSDMGQGLGAESASRQRGAVSSATSEAWGSMRGDVRPQAQSPLDQRLASATQDVNLGIADSGASAGARS